MVKAIKGFDSNMKCRGFQYKVGESYEHDGEVVACRSGFHACKVDDPLAVWAYYPPINQKGGLNRYAIVDLGEPVEHIDKLVSGSIKIEREVSLSDLAGMVGCGEHAATSGPRAHAATSGDYEHAVASGSCAHAVTSGCDAHAITSGDYAHAITSGFYACAVTSGSYARAVTSGGGATTIAAGHGGKVKAKSGGMFAQEWKGGRIISNACGIVGRNGIKADTWYRCEGGKLVETD